MRALGPATALLALAALAALGCNDIPEGAEVGIQPDLATTTDDLTAVLLQEAVDKHPLTYRYDWSVDGQPSPEHTTDVVPASATAKGQTWSVVVTPNDGKVDGLTAQASITILNAAPTATVSVAPIAPTTADDLVATAEGFDDDGDAVTLDYEWARDGVAVQNDRDTVPARETRKGQVWEVTITPSDGQDRGEPVTASVTIGNEPPVAESVTLSPTEVFADTTLTASGVGSDPDEGDTLTWSYTWYVSGGEVARGPGDTLSGAFAKGDEVMVEAVASDGVSDSAIVQSDPVVVLNTPPIVGSASITPAEPKGDAVLSCAAEGVMDVDGDTVTVSTQWIVDGRVVRTGETLDNSFFRKGSVVVCRVTPSDGEDEGPFVDSASVEIGNTPPELASVSITPSPARTGDSLGVATVGATDRDGDSVSFTYRWTVGGSAAGTGATLGAGTHSKGDVVEVTVTPTDGEDTGTPRTASATIANTAPTSPTVAIDPADPEVTDDLVCEVTGASTDADGDRIRYTFSWTRGGSTWTGSTGTTTYSGDTIDSSATRDKDVWVCTVTASDGTDSASPATSTVTVADRDGQVRVANTGRWLDVKYVQCGTGASCNASQAKAACRAEGLKVVSHASNGTSDVLSLGATSSCYYSTSYYTTDTTRASGDCLVAISNLEWSSCCGTSRWHGQTMKFGSARSIFGYVYSRDTGYVSSYSNTRQTTWGCWSETSSAANNSCSRMFVACAK